MPAAGNRTLDLRRAFHVRLEQASIATTSILNGMFADMLTGQAPFILFKFKRVLYWENADQRMDFTTVSRAKLDPLDNDRYPGFRWTTVREVLAGSSSAGGAV